MSSEHARISANDALELLGARALTVNEVSTSWLDRSLSLRVCASGEGRTRFTVTNSPNRGLDYLASPARRGGRR